LDALLDLYDYREISSIRDHYLAFNAPADEFLA
jgi:hypothetical protein